MLFYRLVEALNSVSNAGSTVPPAGVAHWPQQPDDLVAATGWASLARRPLPSPRPTALWSPAPRSISTRSARMRRSSDMVARDQHRAWAVPAPPASPTASSASLPTVPATALAIGQDATKPSARAGRGFGSFSASTTSGPQRPSSLVPSGFTAGDRARLRRGRDRADRTARQFGAGADQLYAGPAAGGTFGDLVSDLNAEPAFQFRQLLARRCRPPAFPAGGERRGGDAVDPGGLDRSLRHRPLLYPDDEPYRRIERARHRAGAARYPRGSVEARPSRSCRMSRRVPRRSRSGDTRGAAAFVDKLASDRPGQETASLPSMPLRAT